MTVQGYLKIAQWAIQSKKSFEDVFKLGETIESIIDNVDNIINDAELDNIINDLLNICTSKTPTKSADLSDKGNSYHALEKCEGVNNNTAKTDKKCKKKTSEPVIEIPDIEQQTHESVLLNMQIYNTTQKEAIVYETQCHSCGKKGQTGQRYCNGGCFKYVEDFNYKCFWGESCKMCHVREQYCIITRDFTFDEKQYWIDDNNNVYNDDDIKIAVERDGNIVFI